MTILRSGSKTALRREWLEQNRIRSALERRIARRLRAEIVRAGRNASDGFIADGVRGAILALEGHAARLTTILDPHWRRTFQIFGERLHDSVKADQSIIERKQDVESAFSFRVQEWIASIGAEKVRNVSNTTIEQIRQTILFGQQEGESNASIATSIRNKTKNISWQRGFVIARTETHSASQAAQKDMLEVLDLPEVKREWVAAEDLRTRDTHRAADGQIRKQNEPFDVGAVKLQFPGDPSGPPEEIIQCRCVAASVVEEVREERRPSFDEPVNFSEERIAEQENALRSMMTPFLSESGLSFSETLRFARQRSGRAADVLNDVELLSLQQYTGDLYIDINPALRLGTLSREIRLVTEALANGIKKLPRVEGTFYRGAGRATAEKLALYSEGEIVTEAAFASTSARASGAFSGQVKLAIRGKRSRDVKRFSLNSDEDEVLFLPGSRFKVIKVDGSGNPGEPHNIYLEEVV